MGLPKLGSQFLMLPSATLGDCTLKLGDVVSVSNASPKAAEDEVIVLAIIVMFPYCIDGSSGPSSLQRDGTGNLDNSCSFLYCDILPHVFPFFEQLLSFML